MYICLCARGSSAERSKSKKKKAPIYTYIIKNRRSEIKYDSLFPLLLLCKLHYNLVLQLTVRLEELLKQFNLKL